MATERENPGVVRMPASVYEQLANFPGQEAGEAVSKELFGKVASILYYHGVNFDTNTSVYRFKSKERIEEKIKIRKSDAPVRDIYGVRFVVPSKDRFRLTDLILQAFPMTPDVFSDGRPSIREYADPITREYIRKTFNPHISSEHSALHINVIFQRQDSSILEIGEVQILTAEELETYHKTRETYVNGRKSG